MAVHDRRQRLARSLKERRPLILVVRETPWNLIQARNVVTVLEAGADVVGSGEFFPRGVADGEDAVQGRPDPLSASIARCCRGRAFRVDLSCPPAAPLGHKRS